MSEQETLYPASTYFQYSNLGLTLLGEIVEEIAGVPYEEYVQQNILQPLGLTDTRTELPEHLYVGYYSPMPWWSEVFISTWGDKLVSLGLPSEKPGDSMTFYKHIEGDTVRRIRDDGELGETIVFERAEDGQIIHYKQHENFYKKTGR